MPNGRVVYVHCWGGFGRTGTVIGCWLRRHGLATPGTVQEVLDRLRLGAVDGQHRESPEMYDQREFIVDWDEEVRPDADIEEDAVIVSVACHADPTTREQHTGLSDRILGSMLGSAAGDAL
ncbi:MAG: protein-tyrosine phosphatase family protein, partial [Acidimicrobiales bacterium]|nr:protein-tyrosine phosphatase family protein [Acidimicrobiales bacterium]